ncbi:MAG: hypothetical protein JW700_00710 [Candidatus Aenigmarchaeota archaeon]|nr:hypothetical protein [Candidatus Aenigmarchaeota archaeon]
MGIDTEKYLVSCWHKMKKNIALERPKQARLNLINASLEVENLPDYFQPLVRSLNKLEYKDSIKKAKDILNSGDVSDCKKHLLSAVKSAKEAGFNSFGIVELEREVSRVYLKSLFDLIVNYYMSNDDEDYKQMKKLPFKEKMKNMLYFKGDIANAEELAEEWGFILPEEFQEIKEIVYESTKNIPEIFYHM